MLSPTLLHPYQKDAAWHIINHEECMVWIDTGLGKTVITLTAVRNLIANGLVKRVLVLAPAAVTNAVWDDEADKWEHTQGLRVVPIVGTPKQRAALMEQPAEINVISYENIIWLVKQNKIKWDMIIYDEVSRLANSQGKRYKALYKIIPYFKRRVGLTASPATNGYMKLYGQYRAVDLGDRLGRTLTNFRANYFTKDPYTDYGYTMIPNADIKMQGKVSDVTYVLRHEDANIQLPELVVQDILVDLPKKVRAQYQELEREYLLELENGTMLIESAAALSAKLRQMSDGFLYVEQEDQPRAVEWLHKGKIDALADLVESLNGSPLLCLYVHEAVKDALLERFPQAQSLKSKENQRLWNEGKIEIAYGHPASMGHGLNLQHGGNHVCMIGLPWDLELYEQSIARVNRQGQKNDTVLLHRILAAKTLEQRIAYSLASKESVQESLKSAVRDL